MILNQAQNEEKFKHHVWRLDIESYKQPVSHEIFVCKISSHECLHLALAMESKARTQRSSTVAVADGENRWALFKKKYGFNLGGIRDQRCQLSNLSRWCFQICCPFSPLTFTNQQKKRKRWDVDVGQRMVFMGSLLLVGGFKYFCWCSPPVEMIQYYYISILFQLDGTNHQASGDWLWKTRDFFRWFFKNEPCIERW